MSTPDRGKVIRGLECCTDHDHCADCYGCYQEGPGFGFACRESLMRDALALLREMEPVEPFARYDALRREFDCGACGSLVGFENAFGKRRYRAKYCPECGRRVRWE